MRLRVRPSGPLRGSARLPGDLHIGQQALVWGALAEGSSQIEGLAARSDHALLARALTELGVEVEREGDDYRVQGRGLRGLAAPRGTLNAGDSVSTLELLVALLAPQRFGTRVEVHESLKPRSIRTLVLPLRQRGANVAGKQSEEGDVHPPAAVAPLLEGELLDEVEIAIPTGDPTTKLALLVSGLFTRGVTAVSEGMLSRDHAERALMALGAPIRTAAGMTLLDTAHEAARWDGFRWQVPGDFTLASFVMAAALALPGSDVHLRQVSLNPTRTALLEALRGTGARVAVEPHGDCAGNEPLGDLHVKSSTLSRVRIGGERAFRMLDEVPALLALAGCARDRIAVRDVGALRRGGSDLLKLQSGLLAQFGVACTSYEDGVELDPPEQILAAELGAELPPELALLACVLGLRARGETTIARGERVDARFPGFVDTLIALGADIAREDTE